MSEKANLLSALRRNYTEIGATKTVDIDLPGFTSPALVVRYQWVSSSDLARGADRLRRIKPEAKRNLYAAADTLAMCCDEIFVRTEDDDELVPLAQLLDGDDTPVRFDGRLADALGVPAPEGSEHVGRRMVIAAFKRNDHALPRQAAALSKWLTDTSREVDEDLLGNREPRPGQHAGDRRPHHRPRLRRPARRDQRSGAARASHGAPAPRRRA